MYKETFDLVMKELTIIVGKVREKKIEPKERLINQLEKNINRAEKEAKEIMDVLFK